MGIEPTYPAWKAGVLPLNYTRISFNPNRTALVHIDGNRQGRRSALYNKLFVKKVSFWEKQVAFRDIEKF